MDTKKIVIEESSSIAGLSVIPVVEVIQKYSDNSIGISGYYLRQPKAIIISSEAIIKAFRITGEEVPLDQLIQEVPELKTKTLLIDSNS